MNARIFVLVLMLAGLLALPAAGAYAHSGRDQNNIGILKDAAVALKAVDPQLAKDMDKYAKDEDSKMLLGDDSESMEEMTGDIKLLTASAAALKTKDPQLSDGLTKYAEREKAALDDMKKNSLY